MNVSHHCPHWLLGLRDVVILGGLAAGAVWGVSGLLKAPVVRAEQGRRLSQEDMESIQQAARSVDAAFEKEWAVDGAQPLPRADQLTIARRLSLALTGSIPSLQEVRMLESLREPDCVQWWLSHLLRDRRSADYLAERLVRVFVGTENGPFLVYRRRRLVDWMSDAIRQNRPYDQVARALISATGVWTTNPAVNFITVTNQMNNKGPDEMKLAARVSRAFLGVQMDCVQCHDGKLGSTWRQQDFHQLAAYFGQTVFSQNGLRDDPRQSYQHRYLGEAKAEAVSAKVPWRPELLSEKGGPRDQLAKWVTAKENRPFARTLVNRLWALLLNRPLVTPVDDIPLTGPFPPGLEALADDVIAHDFDLHRLVRVIAATRVFQQASRAADAAHPTTPEAEQRWAVFPVTRLRSEQVAGSVIQAASLSTIDADTHVLFRIKRDLDVANFVKRYGDSGEDTFEDSGGTIPQRLLLMNGNMVAENTRANPLTNAGTRIGMLAKDAATAVETVYLTILTRRPTTAESGYFTRLLAEAGGGNARNKVMSDLCWTLMNATEFSWNH